MFGGMQIGVQQKAMQKLLAVGLCFQAEQIIVVAIETFPKISTQGQKHVLAIGGQRQVFERFIAAPPSLLGKVLVIFLPAVAVKTRLGRLRDPRSANQR